VWNDPRSKSGMDQHPFGGSGGTDFPGAIPHPRSPAGSPPGAMLLSVAIEWEEQALFDAGPPTPPAPVPVRRPRRRRRPVPEWLSLWPAPPDRAETTPRPAPEVAGRRVPLSVKPLRQP